MGTVPAIAEEVRRGHLVVREGRRRALHLDGRRLEPGELMRELVDGSHVLVAPALVLCERVEHRPAALESLVDGMREQLGVPEGVADALRGDRILVVAGVTDEGPAGAVRPAEEERQVTGAAEALGAFSLRTRSASSATLEGLEEAPLDVSANSSWNRSRGQKR